MSRAPLLRWTERTTELELVVGAGLVRGPELVGAAEVDAAGPVDDGDADLVRDFVDVARCDGLTDGIADVVGHTANDDGPGNSSGAPVTVVGAGSPTVGLRDPSCCSRRMAVAVISKQATPAKAATRHVRTSIVHESRSSANPSSSIRPAELSALPWAAASDMPQSAQTTSSSATRPQRGHVVI
jgi:hypothetical protein